MRWAKGAAAPEGGVLFDSLKEAKRYVELRQRQDRGEITGLNRQWIFRLYVGEGKRRTRVCNYVADFTYVEKGRWVVEDVKSPMTRKLPIYQLKRKLLLALFDIEIREV